MSFVLCGESEAADDVEGETDTEGAAEVPLPPLVEDFPFEQSREETLQHAFDQVVSIDGSQLHPNAALTHPHFTVIRDRLYCVSRDTQTGELNPIVGTKKPSGNDFPGGHLGQWFPNGVPRRKSGCAVGFCDNHTLLLQYTTTQK